MDRSQARDSGTRSAREHPRDPQAGAGCRRICLLTTLHPERALSRALVQHLAQEMPDIDFTLRERPNVDAVWVCGYQQGAAELVNRLRVRHPGAILVVTGRHPTEIWAEEVLRAGADSICSWPVPYGRLSRILHRRRAERFI